MLLRRRHELAPITVKERVCVDQDDADALCRGSGEGCIEILNTLNVKRSQFYAQR